MTLLVHRATLLRALAASPVASADSLVLTIEEHADHCRIVLRDAAGCDTVYLTCTRLGVP